jgi:G3E family GTPase
MKGLLNVSGSDRVHMFQAVYDLYDIAPGVTWELFLQQQQQQQQGAGGVSGSGDERLSRLVLIGRALDQAALQAAFEQCCSLS